MSTLAEFMIVAGVDNCQPMLDKTMYNSWESHMDLFIEGKENGRIMLNSVQNGLLILPTKVDEQGLPPNVYSLVNHHRVAKDIWDRMTLQQVQVNTKLLNYLPSEWSKFVTDVKYQEPLALVANHYPNSSYSYNQAPCNVPRNQATIQDGRVTIQQVQGRQVQNYVSNDPGIPDRQAAHTTIPQNAAFQTEDLDAYDSDCDDVSSAKAVLIANLSSCNSDVLSKYSEQLHIDETSDNEITNLDKQNQENQLVNESLSAELARYKERVKQFKERQNVNLSQHEILIDSQMDDMIRDRNAKFAAFQIEIDILKQDLSKHVKEKESLSTKLTVFKTEFKEK
ncbi:hypothetical protein Tco_0535462 [Tanacetum coccineum]